ncbi:MAG: glucosamine-1-phosphate N-acetyltransferase [Bacillota bacterium]|nr:glucosamine-1-phosphate N-acetyltransferase [Bacillota bacterium]
MRSSCALINTSGKSKLYLSEILYYPLIKWMTGAIREAGLNRVRIICDDNKVFEGIDLSETDCSIDFIYLSEYTGTKGITDFASDTAAEFGGPVLVFNAPVPAVTPEAIGSLLSGVRDGGTAFCPESPTDEFLSACDMPSVSYLENILRKRICAKHLGGGVYIQSPDNTFISPAVKIGPGARILTGSILYGNTEIGENAVIGPNTLIESSKIGAGTVVNSSQVYESTVGPETRIGPFSYIRPGCALGSRLRIGDFVELKNSAIGDGTKVSHLTYIGDSEVGKNVNFGCGTVTVNYDGNGKYVTRIGDNAFIGCNTNLVAPVTVHRGAYTAAGTTVTKDVPEDSLSIGRCRETIKENWAALHREKRNNK